MQNYLYGAGGHSKVVLDAMQIAQINCAGFIDDKDNSAFLGLPVFKVDSLVNEVAIYLHIAIGDCKAREYIAAKLTHEKFFNVVHPTAILAKTAQIGFGTFLAANSIVAAGARVGNHCIINHAAVVDHDCVVSDFCHISPQSCLGGGVKLGKGVLIGAGAIVLPNLIIADYAIIGAGAVVIKNVAARVTVVGNPAKLIKE